MPLQINSSSNFQVQVAATIVLTATVRILGLFSGRRMSLAAPILILGLFFGRRVLFTASIHEKGVFLWTEVANRPNVGQEQHVYFVPVYGFSSQIR